MAQGNDLTDVTGELEVRAPSANVAAPCPRCGAVTSHRRDSSGVLHCRKCMLDESITPMATYEDLDDEIVAEPAPVVRPRRSRTLIIAATAGAVVVAIVAILLLR